MSTSTRRASLPRASRPVTASRKPGCRPAPPPIRLPPRAADVSSQTTLRPRHRPRVCSEARIRCPANDPHYAYGDAGRLLPRASRNRRPSRSRCSNGRHAALPRRRCLAAPGQDRPCGYGQTELIHRCRGDRRNRRKQGSGRNVQNARDAYGARCQPRPCTAH